MATEERRESAAWHAAKGMRFPQGRWELVLARGLMREERGRREFAIPYDGRRPFPLPELFCFARWEQIAGRGHIIYAFDEKNTPIF